MANLIRWDPMREMLNVRDVMDRVFDDFFTRSPVGYEGVGGLTMDMYQTDENIMVKASVPGIKPDDLNISISGDVLTIRGEIKEDDEIKNSNVHIRERRFGSFSRSIALPTHVVPEKAEANFEDGVLRLTLPKAEEVKPKTITVKAK